MVVLFLFLLLIIVIVGALTACVAKCPECGCKMNGPYEDFRGGVWTTIYYCPHCRKEWF